MGTNSTPACSSFPDHPHQCDVIIAIRKAFGALSLIGCLLMIFILLLFRKYVVFAQRLILYLSIVGVFHSISFLMSSLIEDGPECNFQGWWATFFGWQVLLAVSCINFNLFMNVIRQTSMEKFEWLFLGICWVIPLIISCLPFSGDRYGPAGSWCWIINDTGWRIGIWYGPLLIIIILMIVTYAYIICTLRKKALGWAGTYSPNIQLDQNRLREDIRHLRIYPFIYIAVTIFPLINRIQNAISPHYHVFALVLLASISSPLHGALNAIAFGLDKDTLSKLRPSEIKAAFQSKLAPSTPLQEYPQPRYVFTLSDPGDNSSQPTTLQKSEA